ncbi:hypothetical protein [Bacterioplanoides sp.]|uniref:hypothetical protein n=1 Tax=Bacterioplanoides sp. TaxID=2066072 RepID=UPI003AFFEF82
MPIPLIAWGIAGLVGGGAAAKMTGDGIDSAGSGLTKLAVAVAIAGGTFYVLKKNKVI